MFLWTTYWHGGSSRGKAKSEKGTKNMRSRGSGRNNTDTKRNAICTMASRVHFHKLDFSGNQLSRIRAKASITVEASLIATTVIMAVFLCVYYGFLLHDRAVLEEISWQTAQKAMLFVTENSDMEEGTFQWEALQKKGLLWRLAQNTAEEGTLREYADQRLSGELFACDMPEYFITSSAGNVQITYRAHIRLPLFSVMRMWGVPSEITGHVQVRESKQEEFIRLVRGIFRDKETKENGEKKEKEEKETV